MDLDPWPALISALVSTVFWGTWSVVSLRRDRRRLRNGFLLVAFGYSLLGLLGTAIGLLPDLAEVLGWVTFALMVLASLGLLALPFALVANGLTMIRRERRSLGNLLSLLAGLALLATGPVLVLLFMVVHPVTYALGTALALTGLWLACFFLGFVVQTWQYRRYVRRVEGDAVIVLGSRVIGGRVPPLLAARLGTALEAAAPGDDGPTRWLVPSGGQGADEAAPEGQVMAAWLSDHGVPVERIIVEDRARTTRENLTFSDRLLKERGVDPPYLAVTTSYHAPRAALEALDLGLDVHVTGAPAAGYYLPSAYLREFVAVLRARPTVHVVAGVGVLLAATGVAVLAATSG